MSQICFYNIVIIYSNSSIQFIILFFRNGILRRTLLAPRMPGLVGCDEPVPEDWDLAF